VAFPAISCGVYGYPLDAGAEVAITALTEAMTEFPEVVQARFWLFSEQVYAAFDRTLGG
jgi:O-acetyl-ADP-ribose deacetylase (regulator of RNase III)